MCGDSLCINAIWSILFDLKPIKCKTDGCASSLKFWKDSEKSINTRVELPWKASADWTPLFNQSTRATTTQPLFNKLVSHLDFFAMTTRFFFFSTARPRWVIMVETTQRQAPQVPALLTILGESGREVNSGMQLITIIISLTNRIIYNAVTGPFHGSLAIVSY